MTEKLFTDTVADAVRSYQLISRTKWQAIQRSRQAFDEYLLQTYHYIVASVPLMEFARGHLRSNTPGELNHYLAEHIEEERDHDKWLLDDLDRVGFNADAVRDNAPCDAVISMIGRVYYLVAFVDPVAILGHIYALESSPPTNDVLDSIAQNLGIPPEALSTLRAHGENDIAHRQELFDFMNQLDLTERQRSLVIDTALNTLASLIGMFQHVLERDASSAHLSMALA